MASSTLGKLTYRLEPVYGCVLLCLVVMLVSILILGVGLFYAVWNVWDWLRGK